ncbi:MULTISPECIES: nitroreductase family protein [Mycobacterium avium complex (MAC)]|uniref:Nitroreductase n=1 Tax=Mycobacterium timonense TaxID=701043 RepID=A0ABX3TEI7_9MYCO|nr:MULTISPECIES: nitroreductase family protein [Mycobacterium avium complex (MAC)]ETZ53839.1 nitroreductase family protein [Mycobacterium sp. MAC_011194_8550]ETZ72716.1 nitroreductase family protein [Mycobacterium sp. MAC_080597_8934]MBZ4503280.1 nitroreductase family protein [Mycobacterium avium subsp. hominissuis]MBZ4522712.1 nitroreductase family protein [Mycobacterium avium subsp. hominissuis]MBZ4532609.1 nitroreductase family protein [Mycobacterium avium subsp. hominissuis]
MDIATVDELLSTTRSVRKRLDLTRPVGRDVILECIQLAMQAPTASNAQDWRWLVVTDADKRAAIAEVQRIDNANLLTAASAWASIIPAGWSFLLALRSRGLGSVWTTMHLAREQQVADILGIPATVTQAALFPVAYAIGTDFRPAKRPPPETITFWNTWENSRGEP